MGLISCQMWEEDDGSKTHAEVEVKRGWLFGDFACCVFTMLDAEGERTGPGLHGLCGLLILDWTVIMFQTNEAFYIQLPRFPCIYLECDFKYIVAELLLLSKDAALGVHRYEIPEKLRKGETETPP